MTLRDDLLPILDGVARRLPDTLGFRGESLTVRVRTWSGGAVRLGVPTDSDLLITPRPKLTRSPDGRGFIVEGITPAYSGGGYTYEQIRPTLTTGQEVLYIVTGDFGTHEYTSANVDTSKSTRYTLHLSGLERAVPY